MKSCLGKDRCNNPCLMIEEGYIDCAGVGWLPIDEIILKVYVMRKDIHPNYVECQVTCACGNEFKIKSDKDTMSIDICNECHPFFTGSEKIVDAAGRVEKFKSKYKLS